MNTVLRRSAAALALFAFAGAASAQTAPAAQTPTAAVPQLSRPGPVIPGLCIVDPDRVITTSAVGRAVSARLQQLTQQVQAELAPETTAVQTAVQQFEAQQATLQPAQRQQQGQALETRYNALRQWGAQRAQELELTQQQALQRIATELRPVIDQVYGQRNCGALLNRGSIVAANPAMDISDAVIQGLNARIQTFTFNRATLPAQQGAAAAAPAAQAPAATTPPRR